MERIECTRIRIVEKGTSRKEPSVVVALLQVRLKMNVALWVESGGILLVLYLVEHIGLLDLKCSCCQSLAPVS